MLNEKNMDIEDVKAQDSCQEDCAEDKMDQTENMGEELRPDNATEEADKKSDGAGVVTEEVALDPLEKADKEIEELKKQLLYKTAEFENYRKRTIKEKAELILNGGEKAVSAVLPVLDDFERALADKSEDIKVFREGVQMIFNKFVKALEGLGVKKIETENKDFDVDFHEAIAMVPGMGDDKKGKIIDCVQAGYTMNEKVIRHAKVAVGQ